MRLLAMVFLIFTAALDGFLIFMALWKNVEAFPMVQALYIFLSCLVLAGLLEVLGEIRDAIYKVKR